MLDAIPSATETAALLDTLARRRGVDRRSTPATDDEAFAERAAIMEFDGGLPRTLAERFARALVALGPAPNPTAIADIDRQILDGEQRR
ncbi:hypothetical protein [Phreatobacter stygius]|uniref:Uncharacterized protein n=1 Tax=Phreatobacter stygius TaxID=1940610 RepID=A0A4D7B6C6_9HYPH|nr:hypothetical protein [Phreatobacter stygius]QCI68854.1 hypothetical protein E8M01_34260 [Phreatobacter stygius]